MQREPSYNLTIDECILQTVSFKQPRNVHQLIRLVHQTYPVFSEQEITKRVLHLQKHGKLILRKNQAPPPSTVKSYLFSSRARWYWAVTTLSLATTTIVLTIPEDFYPINYLRYLLGSLFVLFLPGYGFVKVLFPSKDMDNIERIALSIGISLALAPLVGLILNYTPWGIRVAPVTLILLALTIFLAATAAAREYQSLRTEKARIK